MKKIGSILIFLVVLLGVIIGAKNILAKAAMENGVKLVTGFPLSIEKLDINLMGTFIKVQNLHLINPDEFEERTFVNLPEFFIDYDFPAIVKGDIHLNEIRLNLEEVIVVRNQNGELNLDRLKALGQKKEGEGEKPKTEEGPKGEAPKIRIDAAELKIGKVVFKDYSGAKPTTKNFNINLNERLEDIKSADQLVRIIVVKALASTSIAQLTNFDLNGLQSSVAGALNSSVKLADDMTKAAMAKTGQVLDSAPGALKDAPAALLNETKDLGKLAESAGSSAKNAAGALAETTKSLTGSLSKLKSPFGDKE
ncbi:MAG: hypothetical protein H6757_04455 [Candidatus Omnitrophica bacterium]|nr:hypothetical protein [Candidatus Omnitrophota bacterium]